MIFVLAVLVVIVVVALWVMGMYNGLVGARNEVKNSWSQIDVQLKRRHDLIPNLVEAVKGYMGHERGTLEAVTRARQQAIDLTGGGVEERAKVENALSQTLRSLFAVAEAYPDLKASANFLDLQRDLVEVEDQIQLARRYYNGTVRNYNNLVQSFPSMVAARLLGFRAGEFFEIERATERAAPEIKL